MKIHLLLPILLTVLAAALTPALAQGDSKALFGIVGEVNAGNKPSAKLLLETRAANANAPGKIPDRMQIQIDDLQARLDDLYARYGKPPRDAQAAQYAARMEVTIAELKRWREIACTIGPETAIEAVTRQPMSELTVGTRLRVMARGDKAASGRLPERLTLMIDALQVPAETPMVLVPGRDGRYEFVGTVASLNPLVLQDGALKMTLVVPAQLGFIQRAPAAIADLKPGQKLRAKVRLRGDVDVQAVERMQVFTNVDVNQVPDDGTYGRGDREALGDDPARGDGPGRGNGHGHGRPA